MSRRSTWSRSRPGLKWKKEWSGRLRPDHTLPHAGTGRVPAGQGYGAKSTRGERRQSHRGFDSTFTSLDTRPTGARKSVDRASPGRGESGESHPIRVIVIIGRCPKHLESNSGPIESLSRSGGN